MNNNDKLLHLLRGEEQLKKLMRDYLQKIKQQTQQRQQARLLVKQVQRQLQISGGKLSSNYNRPCPD